VTINKKSALINVKTPCCIWIPRCSIGNAQYHTNA